MARKTASLVHAPTPASAPLEIPDGLEMHRRRLIAPILAARRVINIDREQVAPNGAADAVVGLAQRPGLELATLLPDLCAALRAGGALVVVASDRAESLARALASVFDNVRRFPQRAVSGSLIVDARLASARAIALADRPAAAHSSCEMFVCSNAALPVLSPGLFEEAVASHADDATPSASEPSFDGGELRSRAAALVDRLASLDAERAASRQREAQLSDALERATKNARPKVESRFDMPNDRHAWPLRDDPSRYPDRFGLYDHRPDDDYFATARAAEDFFADHGLLESKPDFSGARDELNEMRRTLRIAAADESAAPDVSIVIPVYGQLAYTLNCLHGLFSHESRATAEIIVVDDVSPDRSREILAGVEGIVLLEQPENAGFISSSNAGAARARGRIVVMLNNDTRALPGWLDLLVDSFGFFPRAGLVGSKLLHADGSLQEAGGIVFRDGSAWNFGRGDDPNRPIYTHARRVDYISGASLAAPLELWRKLGGFDSYYAPAYYEDTDLSFRVRAAGYETWYQSGSRLIHYEGRTSGTDTSAGVKNYQVRNARKFRLRHREALLRHGPHAASPLIECDRDAGQRALVIEATCPTPKYDAGSVYTVMFLQVLRDIGYKPTFMPQDNFLFQSEHAPPLQHRGVECLYAPFQANADDYLRRHGDRFDVVIVFRIQILERVLEALRRNAPQAPLLFNNHDLHYLRMQRGAEVTGDADALADAAAMKRRELELTSKADCVMTPSHFEVTVFGQELPGMKAIALPLMVALEGTNSPFASRKDVCFLGGYGHPPNVDAVVYFVREILPLLKAKEPRIRFIIAGANPTDEVRALAGEDVIVTGFIDDLREVLDNIRVFVCPLRFGAGMKGKILTSMSYGLPVVTTSVGAEGIEADAGKDLIVANGAKDFAAACLKVYNNEKLWANLSRNGLRLVAEKHSVERQHEVLRAAISAGFERLYRVGEEDAVPDAAE